MTAVQDVVDLAYQRFGTRPDYPWAKYPDYAVLRHLTHCKWYGLVARVPCERLGLQGSTAVDILNVKVRPELVGGLLMQRGFLPAYHMNKEHWVTVRLDVVSLEAIATLLDDSYALTH